MRTHADTMRTQCGLSAKNADTCGHMRTVADCIIFNTTKHNRRAAQQLQQQQQRHQRQQ